MVRLTKIYTRTGDDGDTRLVDFSVVAKTDPRVAAYGDVDEANSAIGVALATGGLPDRVVEVLLLIQNELFDLGADLANPVLTTPDPEAVTPLRIEPDSVDRLEAWCDEFTEPLPTLTSFILPGGRPGAAALHVARTVVRRAERSTWAAVAADPEGFNPVALHYLNRLSDLLFILTRTVNGPDHEALWRPGADRVVPTARSEE